MSRRSDVDHRADTELRFDSLFQAHHDAVYRYCVRRIGRSDAEDAAADVFAVAWRRLEEMPPGDASRAWLLAVAYKVVGNRYRARRRQARLSTRLEAMKVGDSRLTDFESTPSADVQLLHIALDGLSPTDQELLRLWSWDALTRYEIAYVLGIKENAVDQRLHRARSRLKARFDRLDAGTQNIEPEEAPA